MIKDLRENMTITGTFLIKECASLVSTSGSNYLSMILQDASGTIEAKKFNVYAKDYDIYQIGNFVEVDADTNIFKDKLQLIIRFGSVLDPNKIDVTHYVKTSSISKDELKKEVYGYIDSIKNHNLHLIVKTIIDRYQEQFLTYPAAVKNHHDFFGGLATHTLSMCKTADYISKEVYKDINRDLLVSGCILHDIGKIVELSGPIATTYTVEGKLLGHLVIGMNLVHEVAKELQLTSEESLLLEHMLLAHHGKLEYGSPILPMVKEGYILSMIDELDAKINAIEKSLEVVKDGSFSERIFSLDNRSFYKPLDEDSGD